MTKPENQTPASKAQPCVQNQNPYSSQYVEGDCFNSHECRDAAFEPITMEQHVAAQDARRELMAKTRANL